MSLPGFIELTLDNDLEMLVALHAVGKVTPHRISEAKQYARIELVFGASGKQEYNVKQSYEKVFQLMHEAQPATTTAIVGDSMIKELIRLQQELIMAKDDIIGLMRGGLNRPT